MDRLTTGVARWLLPLLVLPLFVVACDDDDPIGSQDAEVSLLLTDNPGDVAAVWVEIGEIYLQGGGEDGRVPLVTESQADALGLIELTELAGTTLELVSDVQVDPGNYGQMRFVVEGAVLETDGGEVYTFNAEHPEGTAATGSLQCPSCSQTGFKVLLPGEVADLEAGAHLIVLDFDVSQTFGRMAGTSGMWVMSPVIHAAEVGFTGSVSGTVVVGDDADGNPVLPIDCPAGTSRDVTEFIPMATAQTVTDDSGNPLVATATVDSDGSFGFPFLQPDEYAMGFVVDVEFDGATLTFGADTPANQNVTSGGDITGLTYTITSASCTEESSDGS